MMSISVPTSRLIVGDIVFHQGLFLEVVEPVTDCGHLTAFGPVFATPARCLNADEFEPGASRSDSFVASVLHDSGGIWTIQGNDLAAWAVTNRRRLSRTA